MDIDRGKKSCHAYKKFTSKGDFLVHFGRPDEAEAAFRRVVDMVRRRFRVDELGRYGAAHEDVIVAEVGAMEQRAEYRVVKTLGKLRLQDGFEDAQLADLLGLETVRMICISASQSIRLFS